MSQRANAKRSPLDFEDPCDDCRKSLITETPIGTRSALMLPAKSEPCSYLGNPLGSINVKADLVRLSSKVIFLIRRVTVHNALTENRIDRCPIFSRRICSVQEMHDGYIPFLYPRPSCKALFALT